MALTTKQIETLKKCRVLIVEDDISLSKRIAELLTRHTQEESATAHNVDEAFDKISEYNGSNPFDLAIVDIMLPLTKQDFDEICELEKTLDEVREILDDISSTQAEVSEARYKRAQALRQIQKRIDRDGGIKLVKRWRNAASDQGQSFDFPILFLTAIGNDEAIQRGRKTAGKYSDWIIKPVPSIFIVEKSAELLMMAQKNGRE